MRSWNVSFVRLLALRLSATRYALLAVVAPLALGGCGLSTKSYSMFSDYNATQQQALQQANHLDESEQNKLAANLRSNATSIDAASHATTPDFTAESLTTARDQMAFQASALLNAKQACDPFAAADAHANTAAENCAQPAN